VDLYDHDRKVGWTSSTVAELFASDVRPDQLSQPTLG
jgi:hypothetical protein